MNHQRTILAASRSADAGDRAQLPRLAVEHLLLRLQPINRALRALAQLRSDEAARLLEQGTGAAHISAHHALALFDQVERFAAGQSLPLAALVQTADEVEREHALRCEAQACGGDLPILAMQRALGLSAFEVDTICLCAAPQLQSAYHRLFAFVHDDLNRLAPSHELALQLAGKALCDQGPERSALAPHGKLLRLGLLRQLGEQSCEPSREFALGPAVLDALLGAPADWSAQFRDGCEIETATALPIALFPDAAALGRMVAVLEAPAPCCLGLWGGESTGAFDAACALAQAVSRPLRRLPDGPLDEPRLAAALADARALGAILLIAADALADGAEAGLLSRERLGASLGGRAGDVILIGRQPWHPPELLHGRVFANVTLAQPAVGERSAWWQAQGLGLGSDETRALAARYAFSPQQIGAVATSLMISGSEASAAALSAACRAVSMQRAAEFAKVIVPRRQPDQLILPEPLHRRVLEVAEFHRHRGHVDEAWGFGRNLSGAGMKVLMTGDSGTGKTAAAEVIAGQVGTDQLLFKVNLAGVVSKWVGETERNLDAVFDHAEQSNAALFFDEADALFAKRGEVERGSDRYANLEVGFLLQRLEEFSGLAILASNHKDQLDDAFMRRFQVILHFPRPGLPERRKLWQLAIPAGVPLDPDVRPEAFEALDLTGAGIVNAARIAGLLAATEGVEAIAMRHFVSGVVRQFQNEARLFMPGHLGEFAHLAESTG